MPETTAGDRGMTTSAHGHGPAPRATPRVRLVLALSVLPALVLTIIGLVTLWPGADDRVDRIPTVAEGGSYLRADVTRVLPEAGLLEVEVDGLVELAYVPPEAIAGGVEAGDRIKLLSIPQAPDDGVAYVFVDHVRDLPIGALAIAYAALVALVARWRGLAALVGLVVALGLIAVFTLPALLAGYNALYVGVVTASAAMFVVLYLAHGFSARTTTALLGTLLGLGLTAVLAGWATGAARLTGMTGEDALVLPSFAPEADLRGVVLCGIILAGLGVLNDVTITQASAVWELKTIAPHLSPVELFRRGMRIGRDHIASTVYTIAFAYVGAALPVMLLVSLYDQPLGDTLTAGEVAEEVVRTLVGSIGLVAAIPLTTAIAVAVVSAGGRGQAAQSDAVDHVRAPGPAQEPAPR
ncbi:YibE/F family protein [Actinotalea sp. K2]|uniref:YibE/F family protein n=1 Tax=Actinotalea sp. K2 TaxID=2939438 RepID=UPI002017D6A7|nr:YibE/F family protein [Actinotalea sp. K2]MCL3860611.1 YibE/F family protein [Actinotalea sp. K2]